MRQARPALRWSSRWASRARKIFIARTSAAQDERKSWILWPVFLMTPGAAAAQNSWGQAAPAEKSWSWTDPIVPGFWMAWTNATAAFFVFVFFSIALMGFLEWRRPGGAPRRGALGLDTTRGDRLFISLLGSAFVFLGWLALMGTPLWGGLAIAIAWGAFVFWRV